MEGDREKLSRKMKRLPVFDTLAAVCFLSSEIRVRSDLLFGNIYAKMFY